MEKWRKALLEICRTYSEKNSHIEWILVGSAGSVLQGCSMEPGDIDIYVRDKESVEQFAELLGGFSLPSRCGGEYDHNWFSSKEEPVFTQTFPSGFTWTKGRWIIEGVEVEVVAITNSAGIPDSLDGDGIWEGGKYIWNLNKEVPFGPYVVRTVPLEIQLESNLRRQRAERVEAIIEAFNINGYNKELLLKALSSRHLDEVFNKIGQVI